jgi:hypothetical protein
LSLFSYDGAVCFAAELCLLCYLGVEEKLSKKNKQPSAIHETVYFGNGLVNCLFSINNLPGE